MRRLVILLCLALVAAVVPASFAGAGAGATTDVNVLHGLGANAGDNPVDVYVGATDATTWDLAVADVGFTEFPNLGFLAAGVWSLTRVARTSLPPWERAAGWLFAVGLVLTGLGSAWYHLAPDNATLVWDRLPLSALFPTVFAVVIGDRVDVGAWRALLVPLVLGAVGSVVWWRLTDDLRPYALAQFLPMLLIPLMLALLPGRRPVGPLLWGIGLYAAAKIAELADPVVFALTGVVSGHTLKHLLAAAASALITLWLAPSSSVGSAARDGR